MLEGRVPTLVQLCQRVAAVHVDYISGLGDELSYDLVKPILERCTVDQLLRLEQASPHLERDTPEIWKQLCFRTYPTAVERYNRGQLPEPVSWREQYFSLVKEEARRIEEAGNKLRRQRQEADDRRKEQEVKFTAQVPQGKRRWGVAAPPKTLFQKTKSDASRLKNIYSKPLLPPMPASGKSYRVLAPDDSVLFPSPSASSRVAVTTVIRKVPTPMAKTTKAAPTTYKSVGSTSQSLTASSPPQNKPITPRPNGSLPPLSSPETDGHPPRKKQKPNPTEPSSVPSHPPRKATMKRDPAASLFMPKHRAYSQRVS